MTDEIDIEERVAILEAKVDDLYKIVKRLDRENWDHRKIGF